MGVLGLPKGKCYVVLAFWLYVLDNVILASKSISSKQVGFVDYLVYY